jgi:hypothetical protein
VAVQAATSITGEQFPNSAGEFFPNSDGESDRIIQLEPKLKNLDMCL